jgi:serine protease Do
MNIGSFAAKTAAWQISRGPATLCAALLISFLAWAPAPAGARPPPDGFADLAQALMPAVVNIATTQKVRGVGEKPSYPRGSPLEKFNDLFGDDEGEINSLGSGFVISPDGVIVTNNHVIEDADQIEVIFQTGVRVKAAVVGRDLATDIAVLRVKAGAPLTYVKFGDASKARVGDWVVAIGNPFGLGGSVSAGIISARNRNIDAGRYDDFIQTDAAINRGNSGGPLFNMNGEVIGVNTAIVSPSGGSVGIGFAVPSDIVSTVSKQILTTGEVKRGWLGVRIGVVTDEIAARNGLQRPRGAVVSGITEGSPAARSGLRPGDLIVSFDGKDVMESRYLSRYVADTPIGKSVRVDFLRSGKRMTATVTIARLQERTTVATAAPPDDVTGTEPDSGARTVTGRVLGMTLGEITRDVRGKYNLGPDVRGLVVTAVDPGSDASGKVKPGDVIVEMAFQPVETVGEAQALAARAQRDPNRAVLLYIDRAGDMTIRSVKPKRG